MIGSGSLGESPDRLRLAIAYLTVPGLLICLVWVRMGMKGRYRKWIAILAAVALVDYVMTLTFARGPGLSIY